MGVLEQITQMKNQGIADEEIVTKLQEQGISPKAINDAFSQAQIKDAVSDENAEEMQPSIINQPQPFQPQNQEGVYIPKTQEIPEPLGAEGQETYAPLPQESPQSQDFYQQDNYGDYSSAGETDTIIEIAEQVFSEKIRTIQKKVEDLTEFKTLGQTKIDNIADRLKRVETIMDKLQITILEKIGSYGNNLEHIKKEMSMMQDSFGKIVNQATTGHKTHATHKRPSRKKTSKKK